MTLISRILGFVRDLVIARYFGADAGTDAFFVAFKIPNFLRRLFAEGSFAQAFVPVLSDYRERLGSAEIRIFLNRTAGSFALILFVLTAIGVAAAPLLILLFAPGFYQYPAQFGLSVELLRITLPYLFFICLTAYAGGILNTWGHFAVPALTPVILNLLMIAATFWFAPLLSEPITALAYGVTLAGVLQLGVQLPVLGRIGLLPRCVYGFHDPGVRRIIRRMVPAVFGVSVGQINLLLNTLIASFLTPGSVSWLYYSDRLVEFPLGIFGVAIGTVILPHLSATHASKDIKGFSCSLDWALRWVILIGLPAMLALILFAYPLVATLFQYDRFSDHDAEMAARSLMAYSGGLLGLIAIKVLVPGFSARQDLATPARYGMYSVGANLALSLAFVVPFGARGWGHAALALGTALASLLNAGLLLRKLLKDRVYRPEPGWLIFSGRVLLANAVMSMLLLYGAGNYPWGDWELKERVLNLALWVGGGFAAYLVCLSLTGLRPRHMLLPDSA